MMKSGTAFVGQRVHCSDGDGVIEIVYNPDNVLIKLDRLRADGKNLLARVDISECRPLEIQADDVSTANQGKAA